VEQIDLLIKAIEKYGLPVYPGMVKKFSEYRTILLDWNKRVNLISSGDESRIITRHFLQSLGLVQCAVFPKGSRVLDLGSGAGFPGIPLKLIRPDLHVILVESKKKKVRFLESVIDRLCLDCVDAILGRVEEIGATLDPVDIVVSRSVTDLVTLVKWSRSCLKTPGGKVIAIKGKEINNEVKHLGERASKLGVERWQKQRYNPFPQMFQLLESFVITIEMC
jgi:16S rRNA (guanine527-N7)-methyltransferase